MRQLGGCGGEGSLALPVEAMVANGLEGHNAAALPFPFFPSLHLPRVDDERLCDLWLHVQKEMSETLTGLLVY